MSQIDKARVELRPLSSVQRKVFMYAQQGDVSALHRALQSGSSINIIDPTTTDSPLMAACRKGFTNIVKLCLEYGAKNDPHPEFGQTALHASVSSGHYGCAEFILKVAAESNADHIISNLTDQYGQTPLHCAALMGSVPLTELLLGHGARIDCVDSYGQTALHLSAGSINKACLAVLLDQGGDEVIEVEDVYGNRPLHHAVYHGRLECAKLLLETAAEVNAPNSKSLTPYNLAVMQGHHQIGLLLQEYLDGGSAAPTPSKPSLYTPKKNVSNRNAILQTPTTGNREKEFRTPLTSGKYEIGLANIEQPSRSATTSPLGITMPETRRNLSFDPTLAGQYLPRPHTVGSPSLNNKSLAVTRKSSSSLSTMTSPIELIHFHSSSLPDMQSYNHIANTHDGQYDESDSKPMDSEDKDEFRVIPQLATPLFSRDISNR
jgi:ankyrin repeat protein